MKKVLKIFVFCLLLIAYALIYLLLSIFKIIQKYIFDLIRDLFQFLEAILRRAIHEKRGKLKGGVR